LGFAPFSDLFAVSNMQKVYKSEYHNAYFVSIARLTWECCKFMSLSTGYLTQKQTLIWSLKKSGLHEAGIARKLDVSRQTVHKALNTASARIGASLEEVAKINKIVVESADPEKGFLSGYSSHFKTKAFVTFSARNGIQVWYKHNGNCLKCSRMKTCTETLLAEANDRGFLLTDDADKILPSKLADALFSKIAGE